MSAYLSGLEVHVMVATAIRSKSSANLRLQRGLPPIETDGVKFWRVSLTIFLLGNKLKRTKKRRQPCFTPAGVLKYSPTWLSRQTALLAF